MWRAIFLAVISLQCIACSGGISSYEEAVEAQADVMEEMIVVLEGVTDEASAEMASSRIEALDKRLAEIAKQFEGLPEPLTEDLQQIARKHRANQQEFQKRAFPQMMKVAQYESLSDAWTRAMTNLQ